MSALVEALESAKAAGLDVRVEAFGGPDGGPLLADYDRARRRIAVNARSINRLRALRGDAFAVRFVACAIWHELFHHLHPDGDEAAAHAFAAERSGEDPHAFAALLRAHSDETPLFGMRDR
jgi:hypothetical protein